MAPKAKQVARRAARATPKSRGSGASTTDRAEAFTAQPFVFCIRADGSAFVGDLGRVCTGWLSAMHPSEAPPQGVWEQVPGELLPAGAAVAYFNAHVFLEDVVLPSFSDQSAQMSDGAPQSNDNPAPAQSGSAPFTGRGRRLSD